MRNKIATSISVLTIIFLLSACFMPPKEEKTNKFRPKHNYIILLDLSDRLVVQENQPERDIKIITELYSLFEKKVKKELYIKSRDEIKVVIAPQSGSILDRGEFEDRLYVNMENIKNIYRNKLEGERRQNFIDNLDTLYQKAVFSKNPERYDGADIWKYFYEDLKVDYKTDTLTSNYLFIITDGYPIVGKNQNKLGDIKSLYPDLHVVLIEASPRAKDLEWDRVMAVWEEWFDKIGVKKYTLIKRGSITKEIEQIRTILEEGASEDKP